MSDARPAPHQADLALAAAAGSGDPAAAERFVRRAIPVVRKVARAIAHDPVDQEDALQLALIDVLDAAPTYRGTGALDHWIRKVASRAVIRYVRKARNTRARSLDEHDDTRQTTMHTTMLESLPRPLEHYLGELPDNQRLSIILRHALGHTISEIAELTEAPVPTVLSRIKKARQELRRLIQRDLNLGTKPVARTS
ncbi:RNA polymerase sigma factor [Paraliomyxa miuraensis]|uniref:RNA polymerase sigma factor n=1 Tax=Paraliomyxa miuraensis TaxID=376150 RepID=UPI0022572F55|nr:sigma-70 family RNA polymerase sigma factor [Paraliomyxa miuraensis]MCX4244853.1 sigma-70 family RNA polymerase sigma factor [Paraliomyxa miuraensis]